MQVIKDAEETGLLSDMVTKHLRYKENPVVQLSNHSEWNFHYVRLVRHWRILSIDKYWLIAVYLTGKLMIFICIYC